NNIFNEDTSSDLCYPVTEAQQQVALDRLQDLIQHTKDTLQNEGETV
ncbi:MAG: hypothetical protein JWM16_5811, partial [Verrucomicrobiales bacterium]|nr:hypothetical protein [Verrucomicrobiales bacterium]